MDYLIEYLAPLLIALAALVLGLYNFFEARRRRRRKLVNAIYHHANEAVKSLEKRMAESEEARKVIQKDETYTPYVVADSLSDELTYNQVIDVMEYLRNKEGRIVLNYFHSQSSLHALGQSFDSDFVRSWPRERKLRAWSLLEYHLHETLEHAGKVKDLLGAKRSFR